MSRPQLVRDGDVSQPTDAADQLVDAINRLIDSTPDIEPQPPRSTHRAEPHTVPMPRGELQRFPGFSEDLQTVFRYKTLRDGRPLLFSIPTAYCDDEMDSLVVEAVALAEEMERSRHEHGVADPKDD